MGRIKLTESRLHPYAGNTTEKEIRGFLIMVLREIKDTRNTDRSG